jgi:Cytochrome P450
VFPDPETFDLRRANATKALVFSKGIHYCLGAALGKLEAQLVLEALINRFSRLRLVAGKEISFRAYVLPRTAGTVGSGRVKYLRATIGCVGGELHLTGSRNRPAFCIPQNEGHLS